MTTGAGLRPGAKATEQPPDPTVGAPALDSTYTIPRRDSRHRCSAEWADVDLEGAEWRYTVTKTNTPHVVPLARQAVEIRRELYPLTGYGRYVFPNARYAKQDRPMAETTLWAALRALDIPPDRMTMHGFRAMARMILDEVLGFRPDFIEHQLAHAVRDPQRTSLQPHGVPARAPRNDASLGGLSGPAKGGRGALWANRPRCAAFGTRGAPDPRRLIPGRSVGPTTAPIWLGTTMTSVTQMFSSWSTAKP